MSTSTAVNSTNITNLQQGNDGPFRQNNTGGYAAPIDSGANAIAGGFGSSATGAFAIGIGVGTNANGTESVAIGRNASATNGKAVSIGSGNSASGNGAVAIGDPNVANGAGAVAIGENNTATGIGAVALGSTAVANGNSAIAIGTAANAALAGNVAIGGGTVATAATTTAVGLGASATGANSAAIGAGSTDGGQANTFAVGGTAAGTQRRVINVAAGNVSATSTDAINGTQLFTLSASVDTRFASIGIPPLPANGSLAIGIGSFAAANGSAFGVNANAAGIGSTAIGNGATVTAAAGNSVALGQGSVATAPGTVSFGTPGSERRLTNVAAGVNPTDAVNFGQFTTAVNGINASLTDLNGQTNALRNQNRRTEGGVAMALAAATVHLPLEPGEYGLVGGVGVFRSETGFSAKFEGRPSERFVIGASIGITTSGGSVGAAAGIGYKF